MICNKCGKEIENEALFCPYCGEKVETIEEFNEKKKKEQEPVDSIFPILGFVISLSLYVMSYIMLKLNDYFKGFGDYLIFLVFVPLIVLGMVLTGMGRSNPKTRSIRLLSWASFPIFIVDSVLLFISFIMLVQ